MGTKTLSQKNKKTWIEIHNLKAIGQMVRKKRKEMGMTQAEAAGLCNVGARFMSELENGKATMHFDKIMKVLRNFGFIIGISERS
jgi:y4mF family transcriptional regulator